MKRSMIVLVTAGLLITSAACAEDGGVTTAPTTAGPDAVAPTAPATTEATPVAESVSSTQQFLAGMLTEEVEPGVVRVLNDGFRDLSHPSTGYPWECERVIVGDSDQVWRAGNCWSLYRVGHEGEWDYDREWVNLGWGRGFASLDGRLWSLESGGLSPTAPYYLRLFDGGEWVPDPRLDMPSDSEIYVEDDGTIWLLDTNGVLHWAGDDSVDGGPTTGSTSWRDVWAGDGDRDGVSVLSVTDDGMLWLITEQAGDGSVSFLRFDGADWELVPGPEGFVASSRDWVGPLSAGVSPDGVLWTIGDSLDPHRRLARLDDDGWTTFTEADGVRPWGGQRAWWGTTMDTLWVAPDGSAWVNASVADIRTDGTLGCDGLARFDGETWQRFLSGHCIADLGFAPDGSAWVVARDPQGTRLDTYVVSLTSAGSLDAAAAAFPEGEPVDLVFISQSSGNMVSGMYAELAGQALNREVRLDRSVDPDPAAIRTTFADTVAGAEIIVFYHHAGGFEPDMPAPTFERGCVDPITVLDNPDYLEDPEWVGPEWTPGTPWEVVAAVPDAEDWRPYREFLSGVWEAIWDARDGEPVVLRGYDVYNGWVGLWVEIGVEEECTAFWEGQARSAREAAEANGATFVSFYDLFNGPDHDEDARAKGWIGDDGFHASEAGAAAAAEALAAVGFELNERPG